MLSNGLYNRLKFICLVFLPALSTLYFTLGNIWGFSNIEEVVGTISALDAFLGVLLGLTSKLYNNSDIKYDGIIDISSGESGSKLYSLELNGDPNTLDQKSEVLFKIGSNN